jgi:hypothetical protein
LAGSLHDIQRPDVHYLQEYGAGSNLSWLQKPDPQQLLEDAEVIKQMLAEATGM